MKIHDKIGIEDPKDKILQEVLADVHNENFPRTRTREQNAEISTDREATVQCREEEPSVIITADTLRSERKVMFSRTTTHRTDVPDRIEVLPGATDDQMESTSLGPEDVNVEEENDLNSRNRSEIEETAVLIGER